MALPSYFVYKNVVPTVHVLKNCGKGILIETKQI